MSLIWWLPTFREIPLELREQSRGGQVNLDMEDHRDEDFVKPKVSFKAFGGEGQKLGRWERQMFSNFPWQYLSCCIIVIFFLVSLGLLIQFPFDSDSDFKSRFNL